MVYQLSWLVLSILSEHGLALPGHMWLLFINWKQVNNAYYQAVGRIESAQWLHPQILNRKPGMMTCVHNPSAEKWGLLANLTKSATPVSERPCLKKKGGWLQEIAFKVDLWHLHAAIHCVQTCVYQTKQQMKHGLSNVLVNELCEHPDHGEWWFEPGKSWFQTAIIVLPDHTSYLGTC